MKFSTKKYLKDRSKSKTFRDWNTEVDDDRWKGSKAYNNIIGCPEGE